MLTEGGETTTSHCTRRLNSQPCVVLLLLLYHTYWYHVVYDPTLRAIIPGGTENLSQVFAGNFSGSTERKKKTLFSRKKAVISYVLSSIKTIITPNLYVYVNFEVNVRW